MEIVKYLCEFFFGNFWHWLGLVIALFALKPIIGIDKSVNFKKKENKEDKK